MKCRHCWHVERTHDGVTVERCCMCGEPALFRIPERAEDGHGRYLRRAVPPEPDRELRDAYLTAAGA